MKKNPVTLIILDGFGNSSNIKGNAILSANTPNIDKIFNSNPKTELKCSGLDVGLPKGQMGNSEVGHTNIGAGRIVYQELTRITKSIEDGDFFTNESLLKAVENAKNNNKAFHIMGLMSSGGVHSHIEHIFALLKLAKSHNLTKVYVHAFMDGRDVSPTSGVEFLRKLQNAISESGIGEIATVSGRYYAMDRDKRFDRVKLAYDALVLGEGIKSNNPLQSLENSYKEGITDEFIKPIICNDNANISEGDSVVFANFRPDRAREITRVLVDDSFTEFETKKLNLCFVCMTQYDISMPNVLIAFKQAPLTNTFGEYISKVGLKQLRIAETEKYAHVTFFFNGGIEEPYKGEDRILIQSPSVATYDEKPEMSAIEVCDKFIEVIRDYDVIILNFANCDMVGHTGDFGAAIKAVETIDTCLARVVTAVSEASGISIITADHGNADRMFEDDGISPFTAHSTNPVPFVVVGADVKLSEGKLSDIAPTILDLMGLEKPDEMDGSSLIIR